MKLYEASIPFMLNRGQPEPGPATLTSVFHMRGSNPLRRPRRKPRAKSHNRLFSEQVWALILVPFCLGVVGALVLFHFLTSTAKVQNRAYTIGGAAAGFVVLFGLLHYAAQQPFLSETAFHRLATDDLADQLLRIAEVHRDVRERDNPVLRKIADEALKSTEQRLGDLSHGHYTIAATDLWDHLEPMIDGATERYAATQYVLPSTFWNQWWSQAYLEKNGAAAQRGIAVTRVFILERDQPEEETALLTNIINQHRQLGIEIRLVDAVRYRQKVNPDDIQDFVIVDETLTAALVLDRQGKFRQVAFSTNPDVLQERRRAFERLLRNSVSYEEWRAGPRSGPNP